MWTFLIPNYANKSTFEYLLVMCYKIEGDTLQWLSYLRRQIASLIFYSFLDMAAWLHRMAELENYAEAI